MKPFNLLEPIQVISLTDEQKIKYFPETYEAARCQGERLYERGYHRNVLNKIITEFLEPIESIVHVLGIYDGYDKIRMKDLKYNTEEEMYKDIEKDNKDWKSCG